MFFHRKPNLVFKNKLTALNGPEYQVVKTLFRKKLNHSSFIRHSLLQRPSRAQWFVSCLNSLFYELSVLFYGMKCVIHSVSLIKV